MPPSDTITATATRAATRRRVERCDVAVVGGGPAGLSAALVLGRARLSVLVLDAGCPSNAVSPAIGGLLTHRRVDAAALRADARAQLAPLPTVTVAPGEVRDAAPLPAGGIALTTADARTLHARAVLLAQGLRYEPPAVPGMDDLWGRSVLHCAFCDGWEVRDLQLAVLGRGADGARLALNVRQWSPDVVLFTDGPAELDGRRGLLEDAGVRVREEPLAALEGRGGQLERVRLADGSAEARDALFVRPSIRRPDDLAPALGCETTAAGLVATDGHGRTTVPGVYAAGDVATEAVRSIAIAVGSGARAAHSVVLDLVAQDRPPLTA